MIEKKITEALFKQLHRQIDSKQQELVWQQNNRANLTRLILQLTQQSQFSTQRFSFMHKNYLDLFTPNWLRK